MQFLDHDKKNAGRVYICHLQQQLMLYTLFLANVEVLHPGAINAHPGAINELLMLGAISVAR